MVPPIDTRRTLTTRPSRCGRFVVVDELYLDRTVFDALTAWALERRMRVQDAIQLALCLLHDDGDVRRDSSPSASARDEA